MNITEFRNRVNQYYDRCLTKGELCRGLIQNLVSEFGPFELPTGPFKFSIYNNSDGNLVRGIPGGKEDPITEVNGESTLKMIHTFRDDLVEKGEQG